MTVEQVSFSEWSDVYMKFMYGESFHGQKSAGLERCDFALIAKDENLDPVGFVTCHEMDSETLYWQFGGATSKIQNSASVLRHYIDFLAWSLSKYKRVTTRIENTNTRMLKIAIKCGFLVYGVWNFKNKIYLELCIEPGGE